MGGVNKAMILGRLGQDPELTFTNNGKSVANFSVATSTEWKDKESGERKEDTQWHKIVVWGPQAESCSKYLSKGRQVFVEGEIRTRNYEDKDGVKRYVTEIVARDVRFIGSRNNNTDEPEANQGSAGSPEKSGDEIPF